MFYQQVGPFKQSNWTLFKFFNKQLLRSMCFYFGFFFRKMSNISNIKKSAYYAYLNRTCHFKTDSDSEEAMEFEENHAHEEKSVESLEKQDEIIKNVLNFCLKKATKRNISVLIFAVLR